MQLIITDAWLARSRAVHLSGTRLLFSIAALSLALMLASAALYHWVILKGAREGWPVIGSLVRFVVKDDAAQRERYLRENIEVMARKLGEMQAKMLQIESLGERVSGLAGVNPAELRIKPGQGGPLVAAQDLSLEALQAEIEGFDRWTRESMDVMTVIESRLIEQQIKKMLIPTQMPVLGVSPGSSFGWRIDPLTGRMALHTGLDFASEIGTPIYSAAGGVVVTQEFHPQYGHMVEIDHGNDLVSRYAHASRVVVKKATWSSGVKKLPKSVHQGAQPDHTCILVLVQGVHQNPQRFLAKASPSVALAQR